MFKQLCFFKKRPDRTMDQFINYYETMHSKLAQRLGLPSSLPNASRYVRRYIHKAEHNPVTWELIHPGYDCLMEIWWDSREHFEKAMHALHHSPHLPARVKDELELFATNANPVCSVEECESARGPDGSTPQWVPVKEGEKAPDAKGLEDDYKKPDTQVFKQVCFFKKRPDMTMAQFKDYYENGHSKLGQKVGTTFTPGSFRYLRRYLTVERNPITWEKHDPGYDCIMEIWWKSRADFEKAMAGIHNSKALDKLVEDEKKLFASHSNPIVTVQELDEPLGPNGTMLKWLPMLA